MADKEIIIDGVDVSGCVSFDKLNGQNICCYEDTREDKIPFANFCVENKDCYFKQLARKTQELENTTRRFDACNNLLDKLIEALGYNPNEIEDIYDFDELLETIKSKEKLQ